MKNKDKYKKELNSIKPSRGLVEDTINMIKNNKLEKKSFWLTYKKPVVAFACSFVVLATVFGVYTYQNSSTVFQKTTINDVKASKYITAKESDKEFAEFLETSGLNEINKENDSDFIITYNGKGLRTNDYSAYETTMRYVKYINRYKYISYFRSKDVFTEEQGYKYIGINLDEWIIVNVNNKYKICIPDTIEGAVVIIDIKAKDFTFYKLYINSSEKDNEQFLNILRKNLIDIYNRSNNSTSNNVVENNSEENDSNEVVNNNTNNENTTTNNEKSNYVPKLYGDVNRDGVINTRDASIIRQFVSGQYGQGFDSVQYELADVNGDGEITGLDAKLVQYVVVKAIEFDGKKQIKNVTLYGDVSKSGVIEQADYDMLNSYLEGNMELDNIQKASADVNDDGKINRVDLLIIQGMINNYFSYEMLSPVLDYTLYGDVDCDGYIKSRDATVILQYLKNNRILDPQQMKNADVNADGKVDDTDRKLIQEFVVQMHEDTLPFKPIK